MARTTDIRSGRLPQRAARAVPARRAPAVVERVTRYLQEVWAELKRVDWPSRRELVGSTLVVLVVLFTLALYLGLWDWLFTLSIRRWLIGS